MSSFQGANDFVDRVIAATFGRCAKVVEIGTVVGVFVLKSVYSIVRGLCSLYYKLQSLKLKA